MLLDITNTCRMGCPHCMQRSTPEPQHMTDDTFAKAMAFIGRSGASFVLVSGGEPTEHPKWREYVGDVAARGYYVIVPTNGMWIGTPKEDEMVSLLKNHGNVALQVTTVDGLYPLHAETEKKIAGMKERLKREGLRRRMEVATRIESMVDLGRCCDHPETSREAAENERSTTSCFMAALIAAQTGLRETVGILEARIKLCHPLIDWQGGIHWSESWLCPAFAHVSDDWERICRSAGTWRPCGRCSGYQKLLRKAEEKYVRGRNILGIKENDNQKGD